MKRSSLNPLIIDSANLLGALPDPSGFETSATGLPSNTPEHMKNYDVMFSWKGNGTTVSNKAKIVTGSDSETIAHISELGKITFYDDVMPDQVRQAIQAYSDSFEFTHLGALIRTHPYSVTQGFYFILHPDTRVEIARFPMENAGPQKYLLSQSEIKTQVEQYFHRHNQGIWYEDYPLLKPDYKDALLLIRGDLHYKLFDTDAVLASRVLQMELQQLEVDNEKVAMVEFPHAAYERCMNLFVAAGHQGGVEDADQLPF